jgi:hypothetical protein
MYPAGQESCSLFSLASQSQEISHALCMIEDYRTLLSSFDSCFATKTISDFSVLFSGIVYFRMLKNASASQLA